MVVEVRLVVVEADLGGGLTEVVIGVIEQLVVSIQLRVSKVITEGGSSSKVNIWPNLSCLSLLNLYFSLYIRVCFLKAGL